MLAEVDNRFKAEEAARLSAERQVADAEARASAEQAGRLRAERLAADAEARASAEAAGRERTERLLAEAEGTTSLSSKVEVLRMHLESKLGGRSALQKACIARTTTACADAMCVAPCGPSQSPPTLRCTIT